MQRIRVLCSLTIIVESINLDYKIVQKTINKGGVTIMKKFIAISSLLIILAGIIVFTLPVRAIDDSFPEEGVQTWHRYDDPCPDKKREKTRCKAGGWEQCTAQYCN